ncbi:Mediator of RNA polymerase II transcription subunit 20a [Dionaea muscipula]
MPAKWVLHWHPITGASVNTQILDEISQGIESINGVKDGRWKAVLTFYKPIVRDQSMAAEFPRDFLGISLPDEPYKYYFVVRGQRIIVEADLSIQAIMDKLQSYKLRVALNFEGIQYGLGDFRVRVGKVVPSHLTHSETMRGIVMEVEYLPISSIDQSKQIMEEFVDIVQEILSNKPLPGHFVHSEPNFAEYGLSDQYTSQHAAIQYSTVMAQLIARHSQ